jgi:hypothetical protein
MGSAVMDDHDQREEQPAPETKAHDAPDYKSPKAPTQRPGRRYHQRATGL